MKIIFLDIDGVLNSRKCYKEHQHPPLNPYGQLDLCPIYCERLGSFLNQNPDIQIVVSSSWRRVNSLGQLKQKLSDALGINPDRIIDTTPALGIERGHEIQFWLDKQSERPLSFCILDDDDDMEHLSIALVQTCFWEDGIEQKHIDMILTTISQNTLQKSG